MTLFGRAFADGDKLDLDGAVVRLKVNPRARRISIRLDRKTGEIVAVSPTARRLAEAVAFARSRDQWIAQHLADRPQAQALTAGMMIEVFGAPVALAATSGRARWLESDDAAPARIVAMGQGEGFTRAVIRQIRKRALVVLTDRTVDYAARLGAATPQVAVTDTHSRWGSCTPARAGTAPAIRYSWRLALAPFVVADYVAAHECAHLIEPNHGPRFWAQVQALVGDHRPHRAWLRANGARLHAFGRVSRID